MSQILHNGYSLNLGNRTLYKYENIGSFFFFKSHKIIYYNHDLKHLEDKGILPICVTVHNTSPLQPFDSSVFSLGVSPKKTKCDCIQ